ncbi:MAG: SPFH domain-containing protein [Oscillospiraceae bacterium]|nr:SPFH domain-containing protein [Oscillospiraceae bacterium]
MGLIRQAVGSLRSSAAGVRDEMFREFFYADALPVDVLMIRGQKRNTERGRNQGSDNVITNGSIVAVADGQCMIITDQGRVTELCAEPGEFIYDSGTEASIMYGGLGKGIVSSFKQIGRRFTFGGEIPKEQRVYYINTREIAGNKYGTVNPVPFRVVDQNIGLDIDISIRTNGEFSYRIVDPIIFYTNVAGNVTTQYNRNEIDSMLRTELLTALQPAFARISAMGIRYSALPGHTTEITQALNEILSDKWTQKRGFAVFSFGMNSVSAPPEDEEMIKQLQRKAVMRDPSMAAAALTMAQADAMRGAAANEGGAMMGFMGLGMAQQAGGVNAQQLFQMQQQQAQQPPMAPPPAAPPQVDGWACNCGVTSYGRFCHECGSGKPVAAPPQATTQDGNGWACACGENNQGRFCHECGNPRPAPAQCSGCSWQPADGVAPRFCPECGQAFG